VIELIFAIGRVTSRALSISIKARHGVRTENMVGLRLRLGARIGSARHRPSRLRFPDLSSPEGRWCDNARSCAIEPDRASPRPVRVRQRRGCLLAPERLPSERRVGRSGVFRAGESYAARRSYRDEGRPPEESRGLSRCSAGKPLATAARPSPGRGAFGIPCNTRGRISGFCVVRQR
jgi:hypothetical protein